MDCDCFFLGQPVAPRSLVSTSSSTHLSPCVVSLNLVLAGSGLKTIPRFVISFRRAGTMDLIPLEASSFLILVAVLEFCSEAYKISAMAW